MNQVNLFCDVENCGKVAEAFGFKEGVKTKCCALHIPFLLSKKVSIHPIDVYNVIFAPEDFIKYEKRREVADRGKGNLDVLEASICSELKEVEDAAWREKEKVEKVAEQCFEELRRQLRAKMETVSAQLRVLRQNIDQHLVAGTALEETAQSLCSDLKVTPKMFRVTFADSSLEVANVLRESWKFCCSSAEEDLTCLTASGRSRCISDLISEAKENDQAEAAVAALNYAIYLGYEGNSEEIRLSLQARQAKKAAAYKVLFVHPDDEKSVKKGVKALVRLASAEKSAFNSAESLKWLQGAWELQQKIPRFQTLTVAVGLEYAEVLSLFEGKFAEAEEVLRASLEAVKSDDACSGLAVKANIFAAFLALHSGKYSQAQAQSLNVLATFGKSVQLGDQISWEPRLLLALSLWLDGETSRLVQAVQQWKNCRLPNGKSKKAQLLKWMVYALQACGELKFPEAKQLYEKAINLANNGRLAAEIAPVYHALCASLYGEVLDRSNRRELALEQLQRARESFNLAAPFSILSGNNFNSIGRVLYKKGLLAEAEKSYEQGKSVLEVVCPRSESAARNLCAIGKLNRKMGQKQKAEEFLRKSKEVSELLVPQSTCRAEALLELGELLLASGQLESAAAHLETAKTAHAPQSESAGKAFFLLGQLAQRQKQLEAAEANFLSALDILSTSVNSPAFAAVLCSLSALYMETNRASKSDEYFQHAEAVLDSRLTLEMDACQADEFAESFQVMGALASKRAQPQKAEENFQTAKQLYEASGVHSVFSAGVCKDLGMLYLRTKRFSDAEGEILMAKQLYEAADAQSSEYAENLKNMSILYHEMKRTGEAETQCLAAKRIYEEGNAQSVGYADTLFVLATIYDSMDRRAEAEPLFKSASRLYEMNSQRKQKEKAEIALARLRVACGAVKNL